MFQRGHVAVEHVCGMLENRVTIFRMDDVDPQERVGIEIVGGGSP